MGNCSADGAKLKEEFQATRQHFNPALGELRILYHEKLDREVALKKLSFGSRTQLEEYGKYAELALQYDNIPTLMRLNSYKIGGVEDQPNELSVIINFDYHPTSFGDQLKRRRQQLQQLRGQSQARTSVDRIKLFDYELIQTLSSSDRKLIDLCYLEAEILRLLDHVIGALYFLNHFSHEHSAVKPDHILIDEQGKYLLVDRKLLGLPTNYQHLRQCATGYSFKGCAYLSPKEMASLKNRESYPSHFSELSDVFAIGLIALEMATMEELSTMFDYRNMRIDPNELKRLIDKASQRYSEQFMTLLRSMLELDEAQRINLNVLIDQLSPILTAGLEALNCVASKHSTNRSQQTASKLPRGDFHDRLMQMELIYQHLMLTKTQTHLQKLDQQELQAAEGRLMAAASVSMQHIKQQSMFRSNSVYAMYLRQYEHIRKSRQVTERVLI